MIVGLLRMPAGTGAQPHSHPNEQWIYILEGTFRAQIGDREVEAKPGCVVYVPSNVVHSGGAAEEADVVFFTVKEPRTACTASGPGKSGVTGRRPQGAALVRALDGRSLAACGLCGKAVVPQTDGVK